VKGYAHAVAGHTRSEHYELTPTGVWLMDDPQFGAFTESLAPRYRVHEVIGQGGMATVYRAYDAAEARDVAIKVLKPELASTRRARRGGGKDASASGRRVPTGEPACAARGHNPRSGSAGSSSTQGST
jgi:serine/threonine protein kinase